MTLESAVLCLDGARGGGVGVGVGLDVAAFAARIAARRSFREFAPVREVDAKVAWLEREADLLAAGRDVLALLCVSIFGVGGCDVVGPSTDIRLPDRTEDASDDGLLVLATPLTVLALFFAGEALGFGRSTTLSSLSTELSRSRFLFPFSFGIIFGGGIDCTICRAGFSVLLTPDMRPGSSSVTNTCIVFVTLLFARMSSCFRRTCSRILWMPK